MATFAKSAFPTSFYAASRPTYPSQLFEYVYNYHAQSPGARWDRAIDLGCGTGQATAQLAPRFANSIGIDPSESMVATAQAISSSSSYQRKITYQRGGAESLAQAGIDAGSVDLAIAAQSSHWFDWEKVWPEVGRALRPGGGSAAFWIYSEFRLPRHPSLTPLITAYAQGTDPQTSLGPHWERPGRTVLERHLIDVPEPAEELGLGKVERIYFTGTYYPQLPPAQTLPTLMHKTMRWRDLLGYLRTFSSLMTFHEKYPQDLLQVDKRFSEDLDEYNSGSVSDSGVVNDVDVRGGDIAVRFWKDLREGAREEQARVGAEDMVEVEWPLAMILVKKA